MNNIRKGKQAQLAELIYLDNGKQDEFASLILRGKHLHNAMSSEIKILKDLCGNDFKLLVRPKPIRYHHKPPRPPTIAKQVSKIKLQLFKTKQSFDQPYFEELLGAERKEVFPSKFYRNCLAVTHEDQSLVTLAGTFKNSNGSSLLRLFEYSVRDQTAISRDYLVPSVDKTGVYEVAGQHDLLYFRHLYGITVARLRSKGYKQYHVSCFVKAQHMTNQAMLMQMLDLGGKMLLLDCEGSIHQFDKQTITLSTTDQQVPHPYRPQSMCISDNSILTQAMACVKRLDLRTRQLHTLIMLPPHQYIEDRFMAVHQLDQTSLLVAATRSHFSFYDLRNPTHPLIKQSHCCEETGIQVLQGLPDEDPARFIGYSSMRHGTALISQVDCEMLESLIQIDKGAEEDAEIAVSRLVDGSYQNTTMDTKVCGFPQLLLTANAFNDRLKIRGVQVTKCSTDLLCYSLDSNGGLGLCIMEQGMQFKGFPEVASDQSSIDLSSSDPEEISNTNLQYQLFDSVDSMTSGELELEPVDRRKKKQIIKQELAMKKLQTREVPLIRLQQKMPLKETDAGLDFEEQLLMNLIKQRQVPGPVASRKQVKLNYSAKFMMDGTLLDQLKQDLQGK